MEAIKNTIDISTRESIKAALSEIISDTDFNRYSDSELSLLFFGFEMGFMMAERELNKSGFYFETEKQ